MLLSRNSAQKIGLFMDWKLSSEKNIITFPRDPALSV